jgi:hypothetical protein
MCAAELAAAMQQRRRQLFSCSAAARQGVIVWFACVRRKQSRSSETMALELKQQLKLD